MSKQISEMNVFELVDLLRSDKPAALEELTLRFRRRAKEASERAHERGLPVSDGRPGQPLPPVENWNGVPVTRAQVDDRPTRGPEG